MDNSIHRDALGHLTIPPAGARALPCGHAVALDFLQDEQCPYCVDYEDARVRDAEAGRSASALTSGVREGTRPARR